MDTRLLGLSGIQSSDSDIMDTRWFYIWFSGGYSTAVASQISQCDHFKSCITDRRSVASRAWGDPSTAVAMASESMSIVNHHARFFQGNILIIGILINQPLILITCNRGFSTSLWHAKICQAIGSHIVKQSGEARNSTYSSIKMTFDACLDKNKASSTAALPPPTTITSTNVSKAIVNHPYGLMVGIPPIKIRLILIQTWQTCSPWKTRWGSKSIANLTHITCKKLCFIGDISILNGLTTKS